MKKTIIIIIALLIAALFSGAALAGDVRGKGKVKNVKGVIESVDSASATIDFQRRKGGSVTVNVTEDTKIKLNGKKVSLADLGGGDRGQLKYEKNAAGELIALRVFVMTAFMQGKVSAVTVDSVSLTNNKATKLFSVDASTTVYKDGAVAALADIVVGDHGKVTYRILESGSYLAKKIKASGPEE